MLQDQDQLLCRLRQIRAFYAPGDHSLGTTPAMDDVAEVDAKLAARRAKIASIRQRARGAPVEGKGPTEMQLPADHQFGSNVVNTGFFGGESEARNLFNRYDVNHDGVLNLQEFTTYLTSVFETLLQTPAFKAHGASPAQMALVTAEECFKDADTDGNGELSFNEFKAWFQADSAGDTNIDEKPMITKMNVPLAVIDSRDIIAVTYDDAGNIAEDDARMYFNRFDENGDGVLSLVEFTSYLEYVFDALSDTSTIESTGETPVELAAATAEKYFYEADADGNGSISFDEFKAWFQNSGFDIKATSKGNIVEKDSRALFDRYDLNGDNFLDFNEFEMYLTSVFEALAHTPAFQAHGVSPSEMAAATAEQCFEEADADGNGTLTFDEFKAWFQSDSIRDGAHTMKAVGPEGLLAESDARALFHKYDEDSNGLLDLREFTNYLTSVFEALADTPAFQAHGATPEEMAAATAEQCFDEADEDGNGSLTFDEFKAWFQAGLDRNIWVKDAMMHTGGEHESSSVWIPESDARKLFDKYDVDSNGSLDLHEFTNYLTSVFEGMAHTPAFQAQDATPAQMAEATAEDCFREADKDGSGLLSFEEFKAWYTSSKTVDATAADFAVTMDGTIEESEARSLFIRFDANKDGVLDFEVISQSLLFLHCSRLRTLTSCLPALCILLLDSEYFLSGVLQLPFVRV